MNDQHITPDPPRSAGVHVTEPPPLPVPVAVPRRAPGTRWLLNIFLLFGIGLLGMVVAGLCVALEKPTVATVVFGGAALAGLTVALRPLFVRGRGRFLRSLAFTSLLLAFLVVGALAAYALFFRAYVIPTGSMALGLPGLHKDVRCPRCGDEFAINASVELDAQQPFQAPITGCTCANCLYLIDFAAEKLEPTPRPGTRILVARFLGKPPPDESLRQRIIVYDYPAVGPDEPAKRYVTRALGLPGETIAISGGRLYRTIALQHDDKEADPLRLWHRDFMHADDPKVEELFRQGKFEIIRKPPAVMLALRRLVYDNDHPADDLKNVLPPRWAPEDKEGWLAEGQDFRSPAAAGDSIQWLRYRHILRPVPWPAKGAVDTRPQLITDYFAYNQFVTNNMPPRPYEGFNWVGDLMLECNLQVEGTAGEFWLELSTGMDRFRACFDLAAGNCTLYRLGADGKLQELARQPSGVSKAGGYLVRFANFDRRLTVWVGDALPFGDGVAYDAPKEQGPTANDLQPASLGSKSAAVRVRQLKLWRDTYYTGTAVHPADAAAVVDWADPKTWQALRELPVRTYYVQPGHYFVLGDNSPQSSDSRDWGTVPERLLIGRALLVYAPSELSGPVR